MKTRVLVSFLVAIATVALAVQSSAQIVIPCAPLDWRCREAEREKAEALAARARAEAKLLDAQTRAIQNAGVAEFNKAAVAAADAEADAEAIQAFVLLHPEAQAHKEAMLEWSKIVRRAEGAPVLAYLEALRVLATFTACGQQGKP